LASFLDSNLGGNFDLFDCHGNARLMQFENGNSD